MAMTGRRRIKDGGGARARNPPERRARFGRGLSPTAVAAEALRTGVVPLATPRRGRSEVPSEDQTLRVGDPDDRLLANEYVGEETPGGTTPTPDQNGVDEIGRAYGLQEEDSGELHSAGEVLSRRDQHRSELVPPRRTRG